MNTSTPPVHRAQLSASSSAPFGEHLRTWRQRRRLSQLDLAADADLSTRHLSFVETGRANPNREMVLRLADRLDVPLRERNAFLVAAGYAPMFPREPPGQPGAGGGQTGGRSDSEKPRAFPCPAD